ncbi:DUF1214 domain-containing protein [Nocardioides alcanivorans]|uniref:DUF1214 domain-containing protein n=1 Tax=Nocardioides alcanivorans TaxID=2897352 RepID=UPI001F34D373|nr:DUF1214 domain-containing protein [Nocardioides alcanivorans]
MTVDPRTSTSASATSPTRTDLREAWSQLGESLMDFGDWALDCDSELDRAEGVRHALRYLGHLTESLIERNDPMRPEVLLVQTPIRKFFGDAVDCNYYMAKISGTEEYRVYGRRGTTPFFSAQLHRNRGGARVAETMVITPDMCTADGDYEFYLAQDLNGRPGMVLDDHCGELLLRDYGKVGDDEQRPTIEIERLGAPVGPRPELTEATLAHRVALSAKALRLSRKWLDALVEKLRATPNQLDHRWGADDPAFSFFYGTPTNHYIAAWYDLDEAKAIEITLKPPPAEYVGIDLYNRWFESLEARDRQVHLNDAYLVPNADGSITVRISVEQQEGNWLDPCGHLEGIVLIRYIQHDQSGELPVPTLEVIR